MAGAGAWYCRWVPASRPPEWVKQLSPRDTCERYTPVQPRDSWPSHPCMSKGPAMDRWPVTAPGQRPLKDTFMNGKSELDSHLGRPQASPPSWSTWQNQHGRSGLGPQRFSGKYNSWQTQVRTGASPSYTQFRTDLPQSEIRTGIQTDSSCRRWWACTSWAGGGTDRSRSCGHPSGSRRGSPRCSLAGGPSTAPPLRRHDRGLLPKRTGQSTGPPATPLPSRPPHTPLHTVSAPPQHQEGLRSTECAVLWLSPHNPTLWYRYIQNEAPPWKPDFWSIS